MWVRQNLLPASPTPCGFDTLLLRSLISLQADSQSPLLDQVPNSRGLNLTCMSFTAELMGPACLCVCLVFSTAQASPAQASSCQLAPFSRSITDNVRAQLLLRARRSTPSCRAPATTCPGPTGLRVERHRLRRADHSGVARCRRTLHTLVVCCSEFVVGLRDDGRGQRGVFASVGLVVPKLPIQCRGEYTLLYSSGRTGSEEQQRRRPWRNEFTLVFDVISARIDAAQPDDVFSDLPSRPRDGGAGTVAVVVRLCAAQ